MKDFIYISKFLGLILLLTFTLFFFVDIFLLIRTEHPYLPWIAAGIFVVMFTICFILFKKTDGYSRITQRNPTA